MVTTSIAKSTGFWATLTIATATLSILAIASQGVGQKPGGQTATQTEVVAVPASENEPPVSAELQTANKSDPVGGAFESDPFGGSGGDDPFRGAGSFGGSGVVGAEGLGEGSGMAAPGAAAGNTKSAAGRSSVGSGDWMVHARDELDREVKLRDALNEATELEFREVPLQRVLQEFSDKHNIGFHFDPNNKEELREKLISISLPDATLRDALELILDPLLLGYEVHARYVIITDTPRPTIRMYDLKQVMPNNLHTEDIVSGIRGLCDECQLIGNVLVVTSDEAGQRQVERLLSGLHKSLRQ